MIRIRNVCGKVILKCLIPIWVEVKYGGIIRSKTSFTHSRGERGPDPVLSTGFTKTVLNMTNSIDPDETPRFAASHLGLRYLYM